VEDRTLQLAGRPTAARLGNGTQINPCGLAGPWAVGANANAAVATVNGQQEAGGGLVNDVGGRSPRYGSVERLGPKEKV